MRAALDQSAPPEEILRRVIKARMQGLGAHRLPDWHFRIVAREFSHPTPAMSRMIDKVSRPLYERMLNLIGQIIGLPADNEKTRLCTYSVMGQIFLYALASPILMKLWPGIEYDARTDGPDCRPHRRFFARLFAANPASAAEYPGRIRREETLMPEQQIVANPMRPGALPGEPDKAVAPPVTPASSRLKIPLIVLGVVLAAFFIWKGFFAGSGVPEGVVALSGRIEGDDSAVAAKITGRILEVRMREGDTVKAGDIIAILDDEQVRAREQAARSALGAAEANAKMAQTTNFRPRAAVEAKPIAHRAGHTGRRGQRQSGRSRSRRRAIRPRAKTGRLRSRRL